MHPLGAADLAAALDARVDQLVPTLLPNSRRSGAYWHVGDVDNTPGESLYIRRHGPKAGKWTDAAVGTFGDLLDLVGLTLRLDSHDAREWARMWLGLVPAPRKRSTELQDASEPALEIWRAARPPAGTVVERYLRGRAISLPLPPTLRFHPQLYYAPAGLTFGGMVAAIQAPDRRIVAIHRTYLLVEGRKAQVAQPKMSLGPLGAGAVRLAAAGAVLGLAEGVETGLSAMQIHQVPVWVGLGTRMDAISLPDIVRDIIVFADNGDAGSAAADRAAEAHRRTGRQVRIERPPHGLKDFNDVLRAQSGQRAA